MLPPWISVHLRLHLKKESADSNLEDIDPEIYVSADLLISGLDSVAARGELNRRAVHYKKPLIDGGTVTYYGHVYTYFPGKNACLQCDPQPERERETLAACTLVGIPRKRSHCLLKGQLFFESKHNRPPDTSVKEEMDIVLEYANNLTKEYFPQESIFSIDEAVKMVDQHDPTIITINAVIASLQSQEALKILHHLKGIELGSINLEYAIYNGLIGKFFYFEKPPNKKCTLCGENAALIEKLKLPRTTIVENILSIIRNKGYTYDLDFPPSFWRIDKKDPEEVRMNLTLGEQGIRNYETFYVSGVNKEKKEVDLYIRIKLI